MRRLEREKEIIRWKENSVAKFAICSRYGRYFLEAKAFIGSCSLIVHGLVIASALSDVGNEYMKPTLNVHDC